MNKKLLAVIITIMFSNIVLAEEIPLTLKLKDKRKSPEIETIVIKEKDSVYVLEEDLMALGVDFPIGVVSKKFDGKKYIALDNINGKLNINESDLSAKLELDPKMLPLQRINLGGATVLNTIKPEYSDSTYFNYGVQGSLTDKTISANIDAHKTFKDGVDYGVSLNVDPLNEDKKVAILEAYREKSDPESMTKYRVGTNSSYGGSWGSSARYVGVSYKTDHSLQNDFVKYPTNVFTGVAEIPGTAELFINGTKVLEKELDAGKFSIDNIYSGNTGAGEATLVVTDINGKVVTVSAPLLGTPMNIKKGLSEYSVDFGFISAKDLDIGDLYGSGSYMYGLSDNLTLKAQAEATQNGQHIGVGAIYASPFGTVYGDLAAGQDGYLGKLGYVYRMDRFGFGAEYTKSSDFASIITNNLREDELKFTANYKINDKVSTAFNYAKVGDNDRKSLQLNGQLGKNTSGFLSIESHNGSPYLFAGLNMSLGATQGAKVSYSQDENSKRMQEEYYYDNREYTGFGVSVRNSHDLENTDAGMNTNVDLRYRNMRVDTSVQLNKSKEDLSADFNIQGGAVVHKGDVYFTRPIGSSYAVVETNAPDMPIQLNNITMDVTRSDGVAILPNMPSQLDNKVSIPVDQLPDDYIVDNNEVLTSAMPKSHSVVTFKKKSPGFMLVIDDNEDPVLKINDNEYHRSSKGFYVDGLEEGTVYTGKTNNGCEFTIKVNDIGDKIPTVFKFCGV